ncbi:hypothetical protein Taro_022346 [Colocasia esculenta]|uniref:Uncharacterized protein n=1 Tax=Colocasia esculenta TaxID=4460 RepID=A0A843V535_COLES|nr:hypothetical protein [Colocasia esculenta]
MGMRCILNATALVVAFLLPPLTVDVCMHAKCHALEPRPNRTSTGSARPGGSCCVFSWRFEVLEARGACSRRKDVVRSGGNAEGSPVFVFFAKFAPVKATDLAITTKSRHADPSQQGGASALVTLTKRVGHEVGMFYVVNVLSLVVAFMLPPLSVDVYMHAKCHALGGPQITPAEQNFHRLCSTRGELLRVFLVIRGSGGAWGVFSLQGRRAERGKRRGISGFRVLHEGFAPVKATYLAVGTKSRQADPSQQGLLLRQSSVVVRRLFRNASLVGYPRFFVSQARVFVVLGVCPGTVCRGLTRHEVCLGVGTVVTAIVACGVPEWWHSFGYSCFYAGTLCAGAPIQLTHYDESRRTHMRELIPASVHCSMAWYEPEDDIKCVTAHLKSRDAWRDHLAYLCSVRTKCTAVGVHIDGRLQQVDFQSVVDNIQREDRRQ